MKLRSPTLLNAMRVAPKSMLGMAKTVFGKATTSAQTTARQRVTQMPDLASVLRNALPRADGASPPLRARWPSNERPPPESEAPEADPSWAEHRYTSSIGSRAFKLYIPKQFDGTLRPLVVMLHGCTQSAEDFARGTAMNELAEELGFFVAYPEQPSSANTSRCWNWFRADDQSATKANRR